MSLFTHVGEIAAPAIVTGVIAFVLGAAKKQAAPVGAALGEGVAAAIDSRVPAEVRPAVEAELRALAADADHAQATVTDVAQTILSHVEDKYPGVNFADVVTIVGDFTHAFVAGLAPAPPTK